MSAHGPGVGGREWLGVGGRERLGVVASAQTRHCLLDSCKFSTSCLWGLGYYCFETSYIVYTFTMHMSFYNQGNNEAILLLTTAK